MSEDAQDSPTQDGNKNTSETTSGAGDEFKPITSQDELNKIIGERVKRAKPADYDDLKAKASRLDKLEEANQTELEKANKRALEAEQRAAAAEATALRARIQASHGIGDDDAELFLTGADEETLTRQAKALAARNEEAGKPRSPRPDPTQGRATTGTPSTADQFAAAISGALNR